MDTTTKRAGPSPSTGPRLYAHRGAASELPENTLASFRLALDLGADALETDAHLTKDGHVVLAHDPSGRRVCGVATAIEAATLAEVRSWDAGFGFVDANGDRPHAKQGHRIPTLDEALREFPATSFNVDAKSRHPEMVTRLLEIVKRAKAEDRTLLASFDVRTLREVRARGYAGRTSLAQQEALRLLASPARVLSKFPLPEKAFAAQLPYRVAWRALGIDLGTPGVVAKCHALGLEVHFWTVNDAAIAQRLLEAGADAIMTDDPRAIAPVLAQWRRRP